MPISEIFQRCYNEKILLSHYQAKIIASAIRARGPGCRLLVFGLGNDTGLWLKLNELGTTLFMETDPGWVETARAAHPGLPFCMMPTFGITVATSGGLTRHILEALEMPEMLRGSTWDVILVDAPPGFLDETPGRAVSIYWAAQLAAASADIFVDDYNRALERHFADLYIRQARPGLNMVIPASDAVSQRQLFWSVGRPET
jgi:hypothetical protein